MPERETGGALVLARGVGRTYRQGDAEVVALASATCVVRPGDRIALVGPSGSGKSTLLHLMAGLDTPTSGTIIWPALGAADTLRPAKVGLVFQVPSLLAPLTAVENVAVPMMLLGMSVEEARGRAMNALDRIDLGGIADKLPEELSGGQAQRVAVARALATGPRLMLADEPTGQLDHATAQHLFDALLAALKDTDTALVVATHDLLVTQRMDHVWHMHHGVLQLDRADEPIAAEGIQGILEANR